LDTGLEAWSNGFEGWDESQTVVVEAGKDSMGYKGGTVLAKPRSQRDYWRTRYAVSRIPCATKSADSQH
jgi:hypothetical protein